MMLEDADRLYEVYRNLDLKRARVVSPLSKEATRGVRELLKTTTELMDDGIWGPIVRAVRRSTRNLLTSPVPHSEPSLGLTGLADRIDGVCDQATGHYPTPVTESARVVALLLHSLGTSNANPLGEQILDQIASGDSKSNVLAVPSHRFDEAIAQWLGNHGSSIEMITASEIARRFFIDRLFLVGPIVWYPPHLLAAPRAASIRLVQYDFVYDRPPRPGVFSNGKVSRPRTSITNVAPAPVDSDPADLIDPQEFAPRIDWNALVASHSPDVQSEGPDWVEAELYLLAGDHGVLLDADGSAKTESVEPDVVGEERVRRQRNRDISAGAYIVLRAGGSHGDYLEEVADKRLGSRAPKLRAMQEEWKARLGKKLLDLGNERVDQELRRLGMVTPNLQYRLNPYSIRTLRPSDFSILLGYIGLGESADSFWQAMGDIDHAHRVAGREVSELLREQLGEADLASLIATGWLEVNIGRLGGGTLCVARVEDKAPGTYRVHSSRLKVIDAMEPDQWLG